MNDAIGRRAFFSESVRGLIGGLAGFVIGAGVKELHAKELHLTGNVVEGLTLHNSMIHVHTSPSQNIVIRNIVAYGQHEASDHILEVMSDER